MTVIHEIVCSDCNKVLVSNSTGEPIVFETPYKICAVSTEYRCCACNDKYLKLKKLSFKAKKELINAGAQDACTAFNNHHEVHKKG